MLDSGNRDKRGDRNRDDHDLALYRASPEGEERCALTACVNAYSSDVRVVLMHDYRREVKRPPCTAHKSIPDVERGDDYERGSGEKEDRDDDSQACSRDH